jgi:hypothetical protein
VITVTPNPGNAPVLIVEASATDLYADAGAVCNDAVWGILSVTTGGSVDKSAVGTYEITYDCVNPAPWKVSAVQKTRTVKVQDTTKPVCKLEGVESVTVEASFPYSDDSASCVDSIDGTLRVVASGSVNVEQVGTYKLTYTATDASGNSASTIRTVVVKDTLKPVIGLQVGNKYIHVSKGEDTGVRGEENPAPAYFMVEGATSNVWMVAAAAAAISGVALFVAHVRKNPSVEIDV